MCSREPSPSSSSSRISTASPRHLDIDRYRIDGELRDYIVAARELSPNSLTGNQTDWINRHTVYTHGNGFVAAPANRVNAAVRDAANTSDSNSGYPIYTVSDIASQGSGQQIIPVDQPRIYLRRGDRAVRSRLRHRRRPTRVRAPRVRHRHLQVHLHRCRRRAHRKLVQPAALFAAKFTERNILFSRAIGSESKSSSTATRRNACSGSRRG